MANTTTTNINGASIVLDGSTDWVLADETNKQSISLTRIQFLPSAANDRLVVKDGSATGRVVFDSDTTADANDSRTVYYNPPLKCIPFIDISDCTLGTPASTLVIMDWLRRPNFG